MLIDTRAHMCIESVAPSVSERCFGVGSRHGFEHQRVASDRPTISKFLHCSDLCSLVERCICCICMCLVRRCICCICMYTTCISEHRWNSKTKTAGQDAWHFRGAHPAPDTDASGRGLRRNFWGTAPWTWNCSRGSLLLYRARRSLFHMCKYVYMQTRTNTPTCIHIDVHMFSPNAYCSHMHMYIYIYIHACIGKRMFYHTCFDGSRNSWLDLSFLLVFWDISEILLRFIWCSAAFLRFFWDLIYSQTQGTCFSQAYFCLELISSVWYLAQ